MPRTKVKQKPKVSKETHRIVRSLSQASLQNYDPLKQDILTIRSEVKSEGD